MMADEPENKPNPMHDPETFFIGRTTFITEDPPGGLPLNSPEVIERERKRRQQLAKEQNQRKK